MRTLDFAVDGLAGAILNRKTEPVALGPAPRRVEHYQGAGHRLVVCNISRANENQRRHPQVSYIGEDWLLRQRHIVVFMVLRSSVEKPTEVLARSVIACRNKVGILNSGFGRILRTLKPFEPLRSAQSRENPPSPAQ
jgi:hypothetical protein